MRRPTPDTSWFRSSLPASVCSHRQTKSKAAPKLPASKVRRGGGPAGSAQLHKSLSPDTGGSLEGKRLTQLPALRPSLPSLHLRLLAWPGTGMGSRAGEVQQAHSQNPDRLSAREPGFGPQDLAEENYNSRRVSRPDQWEQPARAGRGACAAV